MTKKMIKMVGYFSFIENDISADELESNYVEGCDDIQRFELDIPEDTPKDISALAMRGKFLDDDYFSMHDYCSTIIDPRDKP